MLTGELKSKVDRIWDGFWSGGISNPLEVIEQITYLLFIKRLDDIQLLEENWTSRSGEPMGRTIFPSKRDQLGHPGHEKGRPYSDLRWSQFKHSAPAEMYEVVGGHVFPFLRTLGGEGSTYATHMRDARFTIPTPGLLQRAVDGLDEIPMADRDTKGDVYDTCSGRSPQPGRTVSSVHLATSSSSWSRWWRRPPLTSSATRRVAPADSSSPPASTSGAATPRRCETNG
jgi:type I restriction enzyme M protein